MVIDDLINRAGVPVRQLGNKCSESMRQVDYGDGVAITVESLHDTGLGPETHPI